MKPPQMLDFIFKEYIDNQILGFIIFLIGEK